MVFIKFVWHEKVFFLKISVVGLWLKKPKSISLVYLCHHLGKQDSPGIFGKEPFSPAVSISALEHSLSLEESFFETVTPFSMKCVF